jgi:hypothetical protein
VSDIGYVRPWNREHSSLCWSEVGHEDCALKAAVGYLGARMEHDRARVALLRSAAHTGPAGAMWDESVDLARLQLRENLRRDWSPAESA